MANRFVALLCIIAFAVGVGAGFGIWYEAPPEVGEEVASLTVSEVMDGDIETSVQLNLEWLFQNLTLETVIIGEAWSSHTGEEFEGIALDDIIAQLGLQNPAECTYTIVAADGWMVEEVTWGDIEDGILTWNEEDNWRRTILPDLSGMYQVRDVVAIVAVH